MGEQDQSFPVIMETIPTFHDLARETANAAASLAAAVRLAVAATVFFCGFYRQLTAAASTASIELHYYYYFFK